MFVKNLQEATERICELKGSLVALDALMPAVIGALDASSRAKLMDSFDAHAEAARMVLLHADISEAVLAAFERDVARNRAILRTDAQPRHAAPPKAKVDPLLLSTTSISTFTRSQHLARATGFFFRRGGRLFLVSSRRVFNDAPGSQSPDRIEMELHTDLRDLTKRVTVSLPLYAAGFAQWREFSDRAGTVDVAALEIPADRLPAAAQLQVFDETDLEAREEDIAAADPLTIVGFSLGGHDTVHRLPVARSATLASAFGVPFQSRDCFLTDGPTDAEMGGAPVVRRRIAQGRSTVARPWQLLGVHSTRIDMFSTDRVQAQAPGLHCAWYAEVLMKLGAER